MMKLCVVFAMLVAFLPGSFAPFSLVGSGCQDVSGKTHEHGDVWYHSTECSRYGCFNLDNPKTYKMTCPNYPNPDCRYQLVSSPDSPFPYCCVRPVCMQ